MRAVSWDFMHPAHRRQTPLALTPLLLFACAAPPTADPADGSASVSSPDTGEPAGTRATDDAAPRCPTDRPFAVAGPDLCQDGERRSWRGVNAMHIFGGDGSDMVAWDVQIVREFISNPAEQPLADDGVVEDSTGAWLHPLEGILDRNRDRGWVTAERFAQLTLDALDADKPVLAECHGAPLVAFVRSPDTAGEGPDGLGQSILEGESATGYPLGDGDTAAAYAALGVDYLEERPLVIDGPPDTPSRVLTSRDWYPQTVQASALTLERMVATQVASAPLDVLVLHGGPVNLADCTASNRTTNDVPCNYGTVPAEVIPADHTHLEALLDAAPFTVTGIDLMGSPPFDATSAADVGATLAAYDVVVYFKHWSTGMTDAIAEALLAHADAGGGPVAIHHGLYNDGGSKDLLVAAFGAGSAQSGWGARDPDRGAFGYAATSYGHFVSTHRIDHPVLVQADFPATPALPNPHPGGLPGLSLVDEIYNNTAFEPGVVFGSGVGEIELLFSNDWLATYPDQAATAGFVRRYDPSGDGSVGRLVFLEPGER